MKIKDFIIDDNGKLSLSRTLIGLVTISYVIYAGVVVYHSHAMPDMPIGVSALVSALHAINKLAPLFNDDKGIDVK